MKPYLRSNNNSDRSSAIWGNVVNAGFKNSSDRANNIVKQQNDYSEALQKQQEFEMKQKKENHDTAKELVNMISNKFPLGDSKAQQEFELYKQTDQYKEVAKHIKKGMSWAVTDGEVQRLPVYKAQKARLDYEQSALEERINNGTATPEDKVSYVRNKTFQKLHDQAVILAKKDDNFENLPPNEQSDLIAEKQNILFNSAVSSIGNSGAVPMNATPTQEPKNNWAQALMNAAPHAINPASGIPGAAINFVMDEANPQAEALRVPPTQDVPNPQGNQPRKVGRFLMQ